MNLRFRSHIATLLLLVLLVPILAACGGAAGTATTPVPGGASTAASSPVTQANPTTAVPAPDNQGGATTGAATTAPTTAETTVAATTAAETTAAETTAAETTGPAATGGDTSQFLVFGNSGEPDSLDTMRTTAGTALIVGSQMLETLVSTKPGTFELTEGLATEWTANEDSTEWTFKLREGVTFHDGTPFNAEAVVFNFERMGDPTNEFSYSGAGVTYDIFPYIFGGYANDPATTWGGVEAVDETTVRFTFKKPTPLFPNYISSSYFGLSSPDAVRKGAEKYGTPEFGAVGTGPFKFLEWRPGESVTAVRNDDYYGEKAKMPGVVFRIIKDPAARFTELKNGSIDFTTNLAPDTREAIEGDPALQLVDVEPFNIAYLAINTADKPFDDIRVRQAVAHAINKQAILDGFYGGNGEVATDFLPAVMKDARPTNADPYAYDPERAKQLLAEAGFENGFNTVTLTDSTQLELELWYMPVSRPYFPTPEPIATQIASDLQKVGINVKLVTEDWAVYLDNESAGKKHGLYMLGWTGDYADPNNFLQVHFGTAGAGSTHYSNPELDALLGQAGSATNVEESNRLFQEAGLIINKDLPRIPIVHAPPVYAALAEVQGWIPNPTGGDEFATITVER